jgi:hypothetical protein
MFALEFLIVIDPDESFMKTNKSVYINMLVRHFCYLKILISTQILLHLSVTIYETILNQINSFNICFF